jgi:hypothetical protein
VQIAGTDNAGQLALNSRYAFVYLAPVRFDLGFTGTTKKTRTTALSFQMGPTADQTAALIGQVREIDLQAAFSGSRSGAEYFQDQTGTIDDFAFPGFLQISLLDGRDLKIDDRDGNFFLGDYRPVRVYRARSKQGSRPRSLEADRVGADHIQINRLRQTNRFFQTRCDTSTRSVTLSIGM